MFREGITKCSERNYLCSENEFLKVERWNYKFSNFLDGITELLEMEGERTCLAKQSRLKYTSRFMYSSGWGNRGGGSVNIFYKPFQTYFWWQCSVSVTGKQSPTRLQNSSDEIQFRLLLNATVYISLKIIT